MIWSLLAVVLLLAANAFFVAAEFALVKVRGTRIEEIADQGSVRGRLTRDILKNLEAYLAACQLGITMASLGLGWVGEPAVAALLKPLFVSLGMSEAVLHTVSFLLGFLIFSSLHIVVGEQVPKTFAIREPEPVALWTAYPLTAFYWLCFPLNWALNRASRAILRTLGVAEAGHVEILSGDEIKGVIGASRRHGSMHKHAHDMLGGILDLEEVDVGEIMTHRKNMITLDADLPFREVVRLVKQSPFTRFPLWRQEADQIIGVVHAKDVLSLADDLQTSPKEIDLAELASPPWFVPETTSLHHQLLAFRHRREHLAIVVDEYGDIQGVVTLEDILEEIVGEIADEKDVEVSGIRNESGGSWLVDGAVTVRDLNRHFDWDLKDEEASTVAGLVIHEAGRIPDPGQSFEFADCHIEVVRRVGHQLKTLRVQAPRAGTARDS